MNSTIRLTGFLGSRKRAETAFEIMKVVMAGDFFPHSLMFQNEEEKSEEAQGHVVMPPDPGAEFVVAQTSGTFGPFEELLHAMPHGGGPHQLFQGGGDR